MPLLYIRPSPGVLVRNPETRQLVPDVGIQVEESPYWLRRIADQDVQLAHPPTAAADGGEE